LFFDLLHKTLFRIKPRTDDDKHVITAGTAIREAMDIISANGAKAKLYMNVHWMVLYNLKVFCSDMKFKMTATAGLSLPLDPMGKMFQNASSLKPLG
jgi:hypothetical protein